MATNEILEAPHHGSTGGNEYKCDIADGDRVVGMRGTKDGGCGVFTSLQFLTANGENCTVGDVPEICSSGRCFDFDNL